ncbi:hypothetical protein, partial [Streptomyces fructofermentans]|uniref:hypothetical protein n=1 Tax=Streptomyces fructofermentans TaxID=152141 RepID=UPI001678E4F2
QADMDEDLAREAITEFLKIARESVARTLGEEAADLDWQNVTEGLADQVEEARALLAPGRREYLRYRIDHGAEEYALELVQPCAVCRVDRVSPVQGLFHLGLLLAEDPAHGPTSGADAPPTAEPGPVAAAEQAEQRAASVTALARQLLAQHPDAGLTVDSTYVFGHDDGSARAELRLKASSLDGLRAIAAATGQDVAAKVSGSVPGTVFGHATVAFTVDGTDVQVRFHTGLTDDEADAWRAQQDQPADGGDA